MSVSLNMDKTEYCAVINFFGKEGFMPNEIHSKGLFSLFSTIQKWAAEFKRGHTITMVPAYQERISAE